MADQTGSSLSDPKIRIQPTARFRLHLSPWASQHMGLPSPCPILPTLLSPPPFQQPSSRASLQKKLHQLVITLFQRFEKDIESSEMVK